MKTPKTLQGREAVPFIEWWDAQGLDSKAPWEINLVSVITYATKVHAFLSQPFTPDMIPEIFEGWEVDTQEKRYPRTFSFMSEDYVVMSGITGSKSEYVLSARVDKHVDRLGHAFKEFPAPKTLNDFISDSRRAGINLKYK